MRSVLLKKSSYTYEEAEQQVHEALENYDYKSFMATLRTIERNETFSMDAISTLLESLDSYHMAILSRMATNHPDMYDWIGDPVLLMENGFKPSKEFLLKYAPHKYTYKDVPEYMKQLFTRKEMEAYLSSSRLSPYRLLSPDIEKYLSQFKD